MTGVLTLLQFLVALLVRLVMGVESERLCAQCAGDRPSIAHPLAVVVGNVFGRAGIGATELAGVHVYEKGGSVSRHKVGYKKDKEYHKRFSRQPNIECIEVTPA